MHDSDHPGACPPVGAPEWRRKQPHPEQQLGAGGGPPPPPPPPPPGGPGDVAGFKFYDPGACLGGWLIDISAARDTAGDVWRGVAIIVARDGLTGQTWKRTWGDSDLGAIELGGALRVFVPYPFVDVTIAGVADAAQTGTVRAQGIAAPLHHARSVATSRLTGYRIQPLDGASPSAVTFVVPPGAVAYTVQAANTNVTDPVKVTERFGDTDAGWYSVDPTTVSAPPAWRPIGIPKDDAQAAASANAIVLEGANASTDPWVVRWLFETAQPATGA